MADQGKTVEKKAYGKKAGLHSSAAQSKAMAETLFTSFIDRLKVEATQRGGYLYLQDIEALGREFHEKLPALQEAFEQSFDKTKREQEQKSHYNARSNPFDRIIVKTFSHIMTDESNLFQPGLGISRRVLPGFFVALQKMVGDEFLAEKNRVIGSLIDEIMEHNGEAFTWEDVYQTPEAHDAVLDTLIAIALHFQNPEKRMHWFIEIINGHLPPTDDGSPGWQFSRAEYPLFLDALLGELHKTLGTEAGRLRLTRRLGVDKVVELTEILQKLDAGLFPVGNAPS